MNKKALYPGSFDPLTNGHLNLIERAAAMYGSLTVAVVINPSKHFMFTEEERADILREATSHIPNVQIDTFKGLLADYVNQNGFDAVVKGLRDTRDFENELIMSQMNATLFDKAETVFLMTDPGLSYVSSSLVKEVASLGGEIKGLVPECAARRIENKLQEESK